MYMPMTDSTQDFFDTKTKSLSDKLAGNAPGKLKKVTKAAKNLCPSEDVIFFVRLFARACQPVC